MPITHAQQAVLDVEALMARVSAQTTQDASVKLILTGTSELIRKCRYEPPEIDALVGALFALAEPFAAAVRSNLGTEPPAVTEKHLAFLRVRGYKMDTVEDVTRFAQALSPRELDGFMKEVAEWHWSPESAAQPAPDNETLEVTEQPAGASAAQEAAGTMPKAKGKTSK